MGVRQAERTAGAIHLDRLVSITYYGNGRTEYNESLGTVTDLAPTYDADVWATVGVANESTTFGQIAGGDPTRPSTTSLVIRWDPALHNLNPDNLDLVVDGREFSVLSVALIGRRRYIAFVLQGGGDA